MTFAQPLWFGGLLLIPAILIWRTMQERKRRALLGRLIAPRLQGQLARSAGTVRRTLRMVLLLSGLACLFVALAQPRWGETEVRQRTRGRDVILIVDTSRSMLANDLAPSRLARVKLAAADLIGEMKGDRIGLVAFAGSAFLQAPLTGDSSAVLASIQEIDTDIIPVGGTNIAEALHVAEDAFGKGESESQDRAIVLFTDGEDLDQQGVAAAHELKGKARIFTVGAGSEQGTVIALRDGRGRVDYLKDSEGQIVKSRLDEKTLRAIADATGGFYTPLRSGPAEMQQIYRDGLMQLSAHASDDLVTRRQVERFQWPLSFGLVLLALLHFVGEKRQGRGLARAVLFLAALLADPAGASAGNRGVELYRQGDFEASKGFFQEEAKKQPDSATTQYNLGTSAFQTGDLETSLQSFSRAIRSSESGLRRRAEYNLGNTLFKRGEAQKERSPRVQDWKNAIQHYEAALAVDPKDANTIFNRDLVKKLLEDEEKEKNKEDDQQQKKKESGNEKSDQKQESGEEQQPGGEQGDKKDQGSQPNENGSNGSGKPNPQHDASNKAGKGEQKGPPKKQPGKGGERENDPTGQGENSKKSEEQAEGEQRPPKPKPKGDIKGTEKGEQERREQEQQQADEMKQEQDAAAEGKMTEAQARALLDSMRNEDARVRLLNPRQQRRAEENRVLRDW